MQLRKIANHVGDFVKTWMGDTGEADALEPGQVSSLQAMLGRYADTLTPWAQITAKRIAGEIAIKERGGWAEHARLMSRAMRQELDNAPTGLLLRDFMGEQVKLIRSLPVKAGERVGNLAIEALSTSGRAAEIAEAIMRTGEVTKARANTIARTEVSTASSGLTMVRATSIGSTAYAWRTSEDEDVRPSHARMAGRAVDWSSPPTLDGLTGHAGMLPNCFPGSTQVSVSNGCRHLWRQWYEGALISIEHEGGAVELTPNHPVLTGRGWVAAKDVHAGDYLIQSVREHSLALQDHENEAQTTFDDLFAALQPITDGERHLGRLFDFHGDRSDHHVDAIRADHLLPGHVPTETFKSVCDLAFTGSYCRVCGGGIMRSELEVRETSRTSVPDQGSAAIDSQRVEPFTVGLSASASGDAAAQENGLHRLAVATEGERDGEFAISANIGRNHIALRKLAAQVRTRVAAGNHETTLAEALAERVRIEADCAGGILEQGSGGYRRLRVVKQSARDFSGHVFTMETVTGWYHVTAAGIIAKNCRCWPDPIIPDFDD